MIALVCMFLAAPSTSVELVDEVYRIPAHEWRYIDLGLKQQPARVSARFTTNAAGPHVRLALMRRDDLERLRNGSPHGVMAVTAPGAAGQFSFDVPSPDEYVLVIDNLSRQPAQVHLRVGLQFFGRRGPPVTTLSPQRQITVVALSFVFFAGAVTFSARRLLRSIK